MADMIYTFLDIIMPELNGIQLGMEIRKKDNDSIIIFLTSSAEYGVDSYSISAKDYILKPYTEEALFSALDKSSSFYVNRKDKTLFDACSGRSLCDSLRQAALHGILQA